VARWQPDTGHWSCRQPYDLILDRPGQGDEKKP